jgi:hypothetical protein
MVANPDLKSEFQTDSNPDLIKIGIRIEIQISDFKFVFNPDFRFKIRIKTGFESV